MVRADVNRDRAFRRWALYVDDQEVMTVEVTDVPGWSRPLVAVKGPTGAVRTTFSPRRKR